MDPSSMRRSVSKPWIFAVALAATAALATSGVSGTGQIAGVSDSTLENGLELVVVPDHRKPVVTHIIWYRVGSADDTTVKTGLDHLLVLMIFNGTSIALASIYAKDVTACDV